MALSATGILSTRLGSRFSLLFPGSTMEHDEDLYDGISGTLSRNVLLPFRQGPGLPEMLVRNGISQAEVIPPVQLFSKVIGDEFHALADAWPTPLALWYPALGVGLSEQPNLTSCKHQSETLHFHWRTVPTSPVPLWSRYEQLL